MFTGGGLSGTLGAADIKKLDTMSPFVGALLDRVCAGSHTCPIGTVFTECVDIMNSVCGRNKRQEWITVEVFRLRRNIRQLKTRTVAVFRAYQKSAMGPLYDTC